MKKKVFVGGLKKNQCVITPVLSVLAIVVSGVAAFFGAKEGVKVVVNSSSESNSSVSSQQSQNMILSATPGVNISSVQAKTPEVLGAQDTIFNLNDWNQEKGILKNGDTFCNTGRKGFEVSHLLLKQGLKIGEKVVVRFRLQKNEQAQADNQEPKLVIAYDDNYRMFVPGKDIGFVEFDNNGKSEDPKNLKDQIDISKDIVLEYFIKHIVSNRVYFGFKVIFTPVGGDTQSEASGQFYSDLDVDPVSLPAKKFGLGIYEGACINIESFSKGPLEDSDLTAVTKK